MAIRKRDQVRRRKSAEEDQLEIMVLGIDDVVPHPQNVRVHSEANIQAIARSLESFGQRTPIVIGNASHEGKPCILKGNGTWTAMKRSGYKEIQVVQVTHLSSDEELAYAIADNKTGDMSEFDFQSLAEVMRYLDGEGVDLSTTGFQQFEIDPLLQAEFLPNPVSIADDKAQAKFRIAFSRDDTDVVVRAIAKAKKDGRCSVDAKDDAAVVAICLHYLHADVKRQPPKKKAVS